MKNLTLAAIAVVCVAIIGYFAIQERHSSTVSDRGLYFPQLVDQINNVTEIQFTTSQTRYSIRKMSGKWSLDVADNYPVRFDLVRDFLVGMSQLRILEAKTDDPDRHHLLDLAGVDSEGSRTILIELSDSQLRPLAQLYVGTSRTSVRNPALNEYYVRDVGRSQTWLTEGNLDVTTFPFEWLDLELSDLDNDQVREVVIMRDHGKPVRVYRTSAESSNFHLDGVPQGYKVRHQYVVNDIGKIFRRLDFVDVRSAKGWIDGGVSATAVLFNGIRLHVQVGSGEFAQYHAFSAQADESISEEGMNQVDEMNTKYRGWVYKLSDQRSGIINSQFDDLIESVGAK
ncbi:MAG: DUF4340 domain-containing protein [Acidiferrobacterales bacterium]|nr:DUF4340 domain-containing protein [Acidiferrobacterales bacterium]